jgi:alcohol dehydrogenase
MPVLSLAKSSMTNPTMKAAVIYEHGGPERTVLEAAYPRPTPKPGWVLLRVRATSLNYHDIFTRRGMPGIRVPLPIIVGSDIAGDVAELGDGVEHWEVGQRVLVDPMPTPGTEYRFIGEQFDGGRAEYCAVHASQLIPLPADVEYRHAASIPLAYATAYRMLHARGQVQSGETVLVLGASGGVGTACVLLAKQAGARVIACVGNDSKRSRMSAIGADEIINYRRDNIRDAVWSMVGKPKRNGGGGVDVAVNFTGGKTWNDTLRCVRLGGRMLTCGATAGFDESVDVRYVWSFEHSIIGSDGWRRSDIDALLELARTRQLVPVVETVLPLEAVHEAEQLLESREAFGKIVLAP